MAPHLDQGAYGWRKSSASGSQNECVEVGEFPAGDVAVRDTKAEGRGPVLAFPASAWTAFLGDVKNGRFAV